jgi:hypothetical protein
MQWPEPGQDQVATATAECSEYQTRPMSLLEQGRCVSRHANPQWSPQGLHRPNQAASAGRIRFANFARCHSSSEVGSVGSYFYFDARATSTAEAIVTCPSVDG